MVFSQALNGCGDTRTPMLVSLFTIPLNILLNALLIFGVGPFPELGIAGAAWGTVIATVVGTAVFLAVYLSGRFALQLHPGGRQWDTGIAVELVRIGTPLVGRRMVNTLGNFPFLALLGVLGTPVVAAFAIGSRVMRFAMIPGYGYSTAASALVGQRLGAEDAAGATDYGWQSVRIALVTQVLIAAVLVVGARPIVQLFGTESTDLGVAFVRVLAVTVVGNSVAQTLQGGLRGAGDTTWPMYGSALGMGLRLVVAALALPATFVLAVGPLSLSPGLGVGLVAVFAALVVDRYARAAVNTVRFRSGRWQAVARRSAARTATTAEDD
jgi:putative MATE family efflux protein